jgi:hypothetical protein
MHPLLAGFLWAVQIAGVVLQTTGETTATATTTTPSFVSCPGDNCLKKTTASPFGRPNFLNNESYKIDLIVLPLLVTINLLFI